MPRRSRCKPTRKRIAPVTAAESFEQQYLDIKDLPMIGSVEGGALARTQGARRPGGCRTTGNANRFVIAFVKRYQGHGLDLGDLVGLATRGCPVPCASSIRARRQVHLVRRVVGSSGGAEGARGTDALGPLPAQPEHCRRPLHSAQGLLAQGVWAHAIGSGTRRRFVATPGSSGCQATLRDRGRSMHQLATEGGHPGRAPRRSARAPRSRRAPRSAHADFIDRLFHSTSTPRERRDPRLSAGFDPKEEQHTSRRLAKRLA